MIRINLLPAREARRRVELRHQFQAAIVAVLAVVGGSVWAYTTQNSELAARQQELAGVEEEIKRLEEIINPTATLECIAKICPCKMVVLQGPVTRGTSV